MDGWRAAIGLIALVVVPFAVSGCSAGPDRGAASQAAVSFVAAVERHDGPSACALLTPDALSSVSGATNVPCSKAILSIDEKGSEVSGVQVWGDAAQVRVGDDVVFLRRMPTAWRVSAAGCRPQRSGPYDCDVSG